MSKKSGLVYSTETGKTCPDCRQAISACQCQARSKTQPGHRYSDSVVRIRRETKGRKGKGVTLVDGLGLSADELGQFAKKLKAHCGSGGTVKEGIIEIQGDHRSTVQKFLDSQGIKSKLAGG